MRPSAGCKQRGKYRKASKQNNHNHVNTRLRRLLFEPLEVRTLLAVLTWDPDGQNNGAFGGSDDWFKSNAWVDTETSTRYTWDSSHNGDDAVFKGTAGTVTLGSNATVKSIAFQTTCYVIQNSTLTLGNGSIDVAAGATATINSIIAGSSGLNKTGIGTLIVSGVNIYDGGTTVNGGKLAPAMPGGLGTGDVTLSGGTLNIGAGQGSQIAGFGGDGTGWTINSSSMASTPVVNDMLTLTDNDYVQGRSAFWGIPVAVNEDFTARFDYTAGGYKSADGITFVLQNDPRGTAALGTLGGDLGYAGITPSAAIALNLWGTVGTNFFTNGTITYPYQTVTPVALNSGNPIRVTLSYSAAAHTLTETLVEQAAGNATFSTTYTGVDIQATVGGTSAHLGFTGATWAGTSTQTISTHVVFAGGSSNGGLGQKNGPGALTFQGANDWPLGGNCEVHEGLLVIDGDVTNNGGMRIKSTLPGGTAGIEVKSGASLVIGNGSNNFRLGPAGGDATATNYADIAGLVRLTTGGSGGSVRLGQSNAKTILNVNAGGVIETKAVSRDTGSTAFIEVNFDGGALRALQNSGTFMQGLDAANVKDGGVTFDTNAFNITVAQPLLTAGTGIGGLTKSGAGTLTLAGTNTYTGSTIVGAGTLALYTGHSTATTTQRQPWCRSS